MTNKELAILCIALFFCIITLRLLSVIGRLKTLVFLLLEQRDLAIKNALSDEAVINMNEKVIKLLEDK
jgi:hypothetical protein